MKSQNINLKEFFYKIKKLEYALCKLDTPYMPQNFPNEVPVGKDIDILCSVYDFEEITKIAKSFADKYVDYYFIREIVEADNVRVRFESDTGLYFQIDISKSIESLEGEWLNNALKRSVSKSIYKELAPEDELVVRLYEYSKSKLKTHHRKYIKDNLKDINMELVEKNKLQGILDDIKNESTKNKIKNVMRPYWHRVRPILGKVKRKLQGNDFQHPSLNDYIICQETNKFLARQLLGGGFNRMDTIVRYMAIENYYGQNNYGFELYAKMQKGRNAQKGYVDRFKTLIANVEQKGFDMHSYLPISKSGYLVDGSHRLALSLFFNHHYLPVKLYKKDFDIYYGIDWFKENDFTEEEIALIESKKEEVFRNKGIYFQAILWTPAQDCFDEIERDILSKHKVIDSYNLELNKETIESFAYEAYECDDIDKWKITKKINRFLQSGNFDIRVIEFEIKDPRFRKKAINSHDISQEVESIKAELRMKYKDKVDNYFHDVILHIGDNYEHTLHMQKVIEKYKHGKN